MEIVQRIQSRSWRKIDKACLKRILIPIHVQQNRRCKVDIVPTENGLSFKYSDQLLEGYALYELRSHRKAAR